VVNLELNDTAAQLLAKLCVELETDDAVGVLSRALGLMEMCVSAKRRGARVVFINQRGEQADVAF
jgi:hypothetical protein